jgi:hypothetical protein
MINRYTAHTLDGSVIYSANTAQKIADMVSKHLNENRKPHIGYTYDNENTGYPYIVWKLENNCCSGKPCKDFNEVAKEWGK